MRYDLPHLMIFFVIFENDFEFLILFLPHYISFWSTRPIILFTSLRYLFVLFHYMKIRLSNKSTPFLRCAIYIFLSIKELFFLSKADDQVNKPMSMSSKCLKNISWHFSYVYCTSAFPTLTVTDWPQATKQRCHQKAPRCWSSMLRTGVWPNV